MRCVVFVLAVLTCTSIWCHQPCSAFSSPSFYAIKTSYINPCGGFRRAKKINGRENTARFGAIKRDDKVRSIDDQSSRAGLDHSEETTLAERILTVDTVAEKGDTAELLLTTQQGQDTIKDGTSTILFATSLIVANTVGSSMLSLPEMTSKSGIIVPSIIFLGVFVLNLLTSAFISDYSISLYEDGRPASEVPVSFKDIADEAFGPAVGNFVTTLTVLFNYCIIIFNVIRFGEAVETLLPDSLVSPSTLSLGFAAVLTALIASFSNVSLSKVTSFSVTVMLISFAALVLPELSNTSWDTFIVNSGGFMRTTEESSDLLCSLIISGPLIVQTMEIQKIVPSVTKLCNFDRGLTRAALLVGQSIPVLMYTLWICFVLGGGEDDVLGGEGSAGLLLPIFTIASILGCTIAGSMSLSEEFSSFLGILGERFFPDNVAMDDIYNNMDDTSLPPHHTEIANERTAIELRYISTTNTDDSSLLSLSPKLNSDNDVVEDRPVFYSLPAVLLAIIPPLIIGLKLSSGDDGEGVVAALDFSGGYLTPLFIWMFPAMLAWKQLNENDDSAGDGAEKIKTLAVIGGAVACGFAVIGLELTKDLTSIFSSFDG